MMNRIVRIVLIAVSLTVLGFACQNPVSADRDTGGIVVSIVNSVAPNNVIEPIEPPLEMSIATYRIELTGPGNSQSIVVNAGGGPASFQSLSPGTWTVTVNGRNSGGVIVGSGTRDDVSVIGGQNASVTIEVVPLSGEGTLELSLTWPQDWTPAAEVSAVLTPVDGVGVDISNQFTVGGSSSQPVATYSGSWSAGYYSLNLALLDGTHRLWDPPPISVRIVEGQLSLGEYELTASDLNLAGIEVNVGADLNNPYTVSFDGVLSVIEYGQDMIVEMSLDPPLPPDEVRWFLGSTEILQAAGAHSITIGPNGVEVSPGRYWLGVLVRRGTMLSSRAVAFQVTPPDTGGEWSEFLPTPAIGEYVLAGRWQSTDPDDQFVLLADLASPPLDPSGLPDDSYFSYQWHLGELNMPQVWQLVTGNPSVVVAIVDTGIAQDLSDLHGTGFVPGRNTAEDNDDTDDEIGHGTVIAGVIAQTTNNDHGVAGMAHGVSLMPIKIFPAIGVQPPGHDPLIAVAEGVEWATDNGADIINLSLGEALDADPDDPSLLVLLAAIQYADSMGVTVVAAAGNIEPAGNADDPLVPDVSLVAAFPYTLAVGATVPGAVRAAYSSWGPGDELDVMAPGGCDMDELLAGEPCGILQQTTGLMAAEAPLTVPSAPDFAYWFGTSLAAPQVTALAALLKSLNSELTPAEIRSIITSTAEPIAGDPQQTGAGLINPLAAVLSIDPLYHLGERWVVRPADAPDASEFWRIRADSGALKMGGTVELLLRHNVVSGAMRLVVLDRNGDLVVDSSSTGAEQYVSYPFDVTFAPYTIEIRPVD